MSYLTRDQIIAIDNAVYELQESAKQLDVSADVEVLELGINAIKSDLSNLDQLLEDSKP